jgi:hypothetical protein
MFNAKTEAISNSIDPGSVNFISKCLKIGIKPIIIPIILPITQIH